MNPYIMESFQRFRQFFLETSTVEPPSVIFGYDEYTDVIMVTKPVIQISVKELIRTHSVRNFLCSLLSLALCLLSLSLPLDLLFISLCFLPFSLYFLSLFLYFFSLSNFSFPLSFPSPLVLRFCLLPIVAG